MQSAFEGVHAHDDSEGHRPEDWEQYEGLKGIKHLFTYKYSHGHHALHFEYVDKLAEAQIEENLGQLSVSQG